MSLHECECGKSTCIWCAPPAPPMTPPSSQPAQPEQTAEEVKVVKVVIGAEEWNPAHQIAMEIASKVHLHIKWEMVLTLEVLHVLRASKVQALEEAARKGCWYCRNRTAIVISDTPVHDGEQWVHLRRADLQPWESCERPELWDLLSLLRPEGAQP